VAEGALSEVEAVSELELDPELTDSDPKCCRGWSSLLGRLEGVDAAEGTALATGEATAALPEALGSGDAGAEAGRVATGETPGGTGAAAAKALATAGGAVGEAEGAAKLELEIMDFIGRGRVATGATSDGAATKFS